MAKFEVVPLMELKTRLPAKLSPLVEDFKERLGKLGTDQGGRLTPEKGEDVKDLRRALKAAAASLNRRVRFPFRGEDGTLSFYLVRTRGRRPRAEAAAETSTLTRKRRGRPRKGE